MPGRVVALRPGKTTVAEAAEAFLARPMPETTSRSYAQTMGRLVAGHGELAVSALDGVMVDALAAAAGGSCAPATWNRHVATLRSFAAFARRRGWLLTA